MKSQNNLFSKITFPLGTDPVELGFAKLIAPGMYWIRMPLPFALNHINLWLLEDTFDGIVGWTLIDCGIDSPSNRDIWEKLISTLLGGKPILRIVVTHMHPDHIGNAHWLCKTFKAPLWMNSTEFYAAHCALVSDAGFGGPLAADFMKSHGLNSFEWLQAIQSRTTTYSQLVNSVPEQFVNVQDGDLIDIGGHKWLCIQGHGHSPEHISLYCEDLRVLISGDMLLPKISTNVSVWANEPLSNPVKQFLNSLRLFENLPEQTLVCPSHGIPFIGIHTRIRELGRHHDDRLDEVKQACAIKPQSAYDITKLMFKRELDLHQITFAMGEALAHLHWWWHEGILHRFKTQDNIYKFQTQALTPLKITLKS